MGVIHEKLVQVRFLRPKRRETVEKEKLNKDYYLYHAEIQGHGIQECNEFREIVQSLIDRKKIEFLDSEDLFINVITGTTY